MLLTSAVVTDSGTMEDVAVVCAPAVKVTRVVTVAKGKKVVMVKVGNSNRGVTDQGAALSPTITTITTVPANHSKERRVRRERKVVKELRVDVLPGVEEALPVGSSAVTSVEVVVVDHPDDQGVRMGRIHRKLCSTQPPLRAQPKCSLATCPNTWPTKHH